MKTKSIANTISLATFCLSAQAGVSAPNTLIMADIDESLFELSLEELMEVEVSSVSKRTQPLSATPAAVCVINKNRLRRSGVTNVPDALRLCPGVHVAHIGHQRWSVSIRGFSHRFNNKLLVLQDGRSIFTPLFSGVMWEFHPMPLEMIERIEVIRGPGASVWGGNAVNGVINIITKQSGANNGNQVSLKGGNQLRGQLYTSHTAQLTENSSIRIHGQVQYTAPSGTLNRSHDAHDYWKSQQAGFQFNHQDGADNVQLQGSYNRIGAGNYFLQNLPVDPPERQISEHNHWSHFQGRWDRQSGNGQHDSLRFYLVHSNLNIFIAREQRTTFDIEYQQQRQLGEKHALNWGVEWQITRDNIKGQPLYSKVLPAKIRLSHFSVFAQDKITLVPEHWSLTAGMRLEHNRYTQGAFQPNLRLLYTPNRKSSFWLSASRALRLPSRGERNAMYRFPAQLAPPQLQPTFRYIIPVTANGKLKSEKLNGLDLGWRAQLSTDLSVDLSAFYYRHKGLISTKALEPVYFPEKRFIIQPLLISNGSHLVKTKGFEASITWFPDEKWRLQAQYSQFHSDNARDSMPNHSLSLYSSVDLPRNLKWDVWLRYHDRKKIDHWVSPEEYKATRWGMDMRFAWIAAKNCEISLTGQNLLHRKRLESIDNISAAPLNVIPRRWILSADWRF